MVDDPLELSRRLLLDVGVCPACRSRLVGPRCGWCGLDLAGDAGAEIWQASQDAASAIARRTELVERLRAQQPARPATHGPAGVLPGPAAPVGVARPHPEPGLARAGGAPVPVATTQAPSPRVPGVPVPPPPAPRPARPAWRVQTVLVTLGASLLALASLVFLAFTWDVLTLPVRALVVAVATAGVLALAAVLRARRLTASAEAVGALGVCLVLLDAWAIRATGLAGDVPGGAYACLAALACAALLGAYGLRAGVRAGTLAAALLVPLAPVTLALAAETGPGAVAGALAGLALTLVRHLRTRAQPLAVERRAMALLAVPLAAATAVLLLVALRTAPTSAAIWLLVAATLAVLVTHAVLSLGPGRPELVARAWAVGAGALAALTAAVGSSLAASPAPWSAAAAAAVVAVTAIALLAPPLRTHPAARTVADAGAAGAAWTLLPLAAPAVVVLLVATIAHLLGAGGDGPGAAPVVTLVVVSASLIVVAAVRRGWTRHVAAAATTGTVFATAAVLPARTWPLVAVLAGLAVLAVLLDRVVAVPGDLGPYPRALGVLAATAGVAAAATASTSPAALAVALTAALVVSIVSRRWATPGWRTGAGPVSAVLAWSALTAAGVAVGAPGAAAAAAALVGIALVVAALRGGPRGRPAHAERGTLLATVATGQGLCWLVGLVTALTGNGTGDATDEGGPVAVVALAAVAAVEALLLATSRRGRVGSRARRAAAALVAPALAATVLTSVACLGSPPWTTALVLAAAIAAAATMAARTWAGVRTVVQCSGAAVLGGVLLASWYDSPAGLRTLLIVLAAATAFVVSYEPDRRPLRWVALGLAVAASWHGLAVRDVGVPEAYLAPLGLVLVVVALRRVRHADGSAVGMLAAGVVLVGIAPALVDDPVAALPGGRTSLLTVGLLVVSAGALGLASRARAGDDPAAHARRAAAVTLAGCTTVLVALGPLRRALTTLADPAVAIEAWSLPSAAVLCLVVLTLRHGLPTHAHAVDVAGWSTVVAVGTVPTVLAALPDAGHPSGDTAATARLVAVALVGATIATLGAATRRTWAWLLGVAVLALATLVALVSGPALSGDALLTIAGALALVPAVVHLVREPTSPSWPTLGPPIVVALVPALVVLQPEPTPWRAAVVVGGGLVAVVVGAVRRLRAPFVVGAAVLGVEAVALALQLAGSLVEHVGWWPLLFLGGGLLVAIGVTYERRLRDAREAVRYVARMR